MSNNYNEIRIPFSSSFLVGVVLYLGFISNPFSATTCYTEERYPNIVDIRQGKSGLEFVVAGKNRDEKNNTAPVLTLIKDIAWDDRTWVKTGEVKCSSDTCYEIKHKCEHAIPEIKLSLQEALKIRSFRYIPESIDQSVGACVKNGDDLYFGLSFYAGEGVSGVGGVGRYNQATKKLEVRRLPALADYSVSSIAFDGKLLWIGTANNHECSGTPPANRLIWYDWDNNIIQTSEDMGSICGFLIHDIHFTEKSVWIATDLGLSEINRSGDDYRYGWERGFRHYIPQVNAKELMKWTHCDALYTDFLNNTPLDYSNFVDGQTYDQIFFNATKFNPGFLKRYIKSLQEAKK